MIEISYKIGEFEYTLDKLIFDIKDGNISIYDIPIASITEKFKSILSDFEKKLGIADLSFFYRMTAELIYLKTVRLLPYNVDEEDNLFDYDLKLQVIEALEKLKFSKYAELLKKYRETHDIEIKREMLDFRLPFSDEDIFKNKNCDDLAKAYSALMRNALDDAEFNIGSKVSVSEKIALLRELLNLNEKILFTDLITDIYSKIHITSSFFAVLDATNRGLCHPEQEGIFSPLYIIRDNLFLDGNYTEESQDGELL